MSFPDSANPFVVGPGGFLLDRNDDGHPDDLSVRIVLPTDPSHVSTEVWCALIDLAARLGLETTGLPDRLVLTTAENLPAGCDAIIVDAHDATAIRSIARAGLPPATTRASDSIAAPSMVDLARLLSADGVLRDRDGDWLPDGTRLVILLPDPCPPSLAVAAIELAARIGLESGGIDLPLAIPIGADIPRGAVTLDLAASETDGGDADSTAHVSIDSGNLRLSGSDDARAALLHYLAITWPRLTNEEQGADASSVLETVRDLVAGSSALGRAAYLAVSQDDIGLDVPIVLHGADDYDVQLMGVGAGDLSTNWDEVFTLDWSDSWEVDHVREIVRDELLPLLTPNQAHAPFDLLILVSEPIEIRRQLEAEITAQIHAIVGQTASVRVRVRSAYKAGLSWLREDVLPALQALGHIDRLELRYAPIPPTTGDESPRLDLPIRWLQELFPGDELIAVALGLPLDAIDLVEQRDEVRFIYEVVAFNAGEPVWHDTFSPRWYRLPYIALDPARGSVLASTGGIRAIQNGHMVFDADVPTDCDRFWQWYQSVVLPEVGSHVQEVTGGRPLLTQQPMFASLRVDAWVSEPNELLGIREEIDSAAEALHEDVYFGSLDWLSAFGTSQGGDELTGPGSIQPFIHVTPGESPRARVTLRARRRHLGAAVGADGTTALAGPLDALHTSTPRITGITVDRSGLRDLAIAVELPSAEANALTSRLLQEAAHLAGLYDSQTTSIPVTIAISGYDSIALTLPISTDPLGEIPPAADAPSDRQILFGDDLPAYLARLNTNPGVHVYQGGRSFGGRPLWTIECIAPPPTRRWSRTKMTLRKPTLQIIARHHANEVSSTTAAFRLAESLTSDPKWSALRRAVNVVILPFTNPDGAALHQELVAEHPTWKHHAARYNAVGLEVGYAHHDRQSPFGEARFRREVWEQWLPDVIVDNHGVPSHEWSQHFAGFGSPPRFPVCYWMVQALLYGIIPHADTPEHTPFAETLRRRLAQAIAADPDLAPANATYGHRYHRWGTSRVPQRFPADIADDFLCYVTKLTPDVASRNFAVRYPRTSTLDWVTEVPDETAHGEHLALTAHAHLVANQATLRLMQEWAPPVEHAVHSGDGDSLTVALTRRRPLIANAQE